MMQPLAGQVRCRTSKARSRERRTRGQQARRPRRL